MNVNFPRAARSEFRRISWATYPGTPRPHESRVPARRSSKESPSLRRYHLGNPNCTGELHRLVTTERRNGATERIVPPARSEFGFSASCRGHYSCAPRSDTREVWRGAAESIARFLRNLLGSRRPRTILRHTPRPLSRP